MWLTFSATQSGELGGNQDLREPRCGGPNTEDVGAEIVVGTARPGMAERFPPVELLPERRGVGSQFLP